MAYAKRSDEDEIANAGWGISRVLVRCDGTIVDSILLHYTASISALTKWNCDFLDDLFYA
jgi:hypothetical protein